MKKTSTPLAIDLAIAERRKDARLVTSWRELLIMAEDLPHEFLDDESENYDEDRATSWLEGHDTGQSGEDADEEAFKFDEDYQDGYTTGASEYP